MMYINDILLYRTLVNDQRLSRDLWHELLNEQPKRCWKLNQFA